jgi:uncharacterized protein YdaU (DUF1376 family)
MDEFYEELLLADIEELSERAEEALVNKRMEEDVEPNHSIGNLSLNTSKESNDHSLYRPSLRAVIKSKKNQAKLQINSIQNFMSENELLQQENMRMSAALRNYEMQRIANQGPQAESVVSRRKNQTRNINVNLENSSAIEEITIEFRKIKE